MDTRISRDTSNSKNALISRKACNRGIASNSVFDKGTAEMPTTPLVTPGTSAIAERPATGNHQELKGCQQQQECLPLSATAVTQATPVTPATSNIKDDSNFMTTHNIRNASNSRNESNKRTANTVWTPPKTGMPAKTENPQTAWQEANSCRDNRNITASTAEGRPITTRTPEIVETSQQQY
jgi:hypothetical protein